MIEEKTKLAPCESAQYSNARSKTCHGGSSTSVVSPRSGSRPIRGVLAATFCRKLRCESTTPLGFPVVPEV